MTTPLSPQEQSKWNIFTYWFVFVNIFCAGLSLIWFKNELNYFLREDSFAENLGALFLFLTSITLLLCFFKLRQKISYLFLLCAIAFFWASGEEVSWGQRIFDFSTPDFWGELNQQNETNFHNVNTRFFNNALETVILLFIIISAFFYLKRKERVFGIITPSFYLILSFQLLTGYRTYHYIKDQDYLSFLVLAIFFIVFVKNKRWTHLTYVLLNTILLIGVGWINIDGRDLFMSNGPREMREYLFSFLCFSYSLSVYFDLRTDQKNKFTGTHS